MGMQGSRGAAVGDKVPWRHSGMGQWMVLGFHRVLEFFKEGGCKLWTRMKLSYPWEWACLVSWAGKVRDGN